MSGHSKWAGIKHKKAVIDAKRGKIFTRHAKLIQMAVREGGNGDPAMNPRLATAIENARMDNVPRDNIERAVKKGTGEGKGDQIVEIMYAAYGPGGVAVLIECLSDNRNRTISNVRAFIERHGGRWAESASVLYMFTRKGVVIGKGTLSDEAELALIEAGADDMERDGDMVTVMTSAAAWPKVRDALKQAGLEVESAGLKYVPNQTMPVADVETAKKLLEFTEGLEEDEDVSEVFTNADVTDEVVAQLK